MKGKNSPKERRESFINALKRRKIDAAIITDPRHVYYFTGYWTFLPRTVALLVLTRDSDVHLFLGESRASDAKKVFDGKLSTFEDYNLTKRMIAYPGFVAQEFSRFLKGSKLLRGFRTIGLEDWHMPHAYFDAITRTASKIRFAGITDLILASRKTKGSDELANLRDATQRLELAYKVARENIEVGKTEMELCRDVMSDSIMRHGPFEFSRGDTWLSGERTMEIGGPPTDRRLREGDTVVLDLQSVVNNYWADGARTYVVGQPNPKQEKIFATILEAKKKAESHLRPGGACRDIYNTVAKQIEQAGYSGLFPHHAGHGLGLEDQEAPFFIPGSKEKLEEGVVCTIEPGIYHDKVGGFRDEDTYIITKDGFEKITVPSVSLAT
jgi:Xaa-Pro dipeptidase